MKFEQSFEVGAPVADVWELMIDLERVAPCLPGAAITERDGEGTCHGTFQVRLGPTTASFRGQIRLERVDESAHTATLQAHGTDKRGQGGASATIVNTLAQVEGGTRVQAATDLTITGPLARFGRAGMIEEVSSRLTRDFADRLQKSLVPAQVRATAATAAPSAGEPAPDPAPVRPSPARARRRGQSRHRPASRRPRRSRALAPRCARRTARRRAGRPPRSACRPPTRRSTASACFSACWASGSAGCSGAAGR